ncbi:hypothetical protein ACFWRV_22610 [Streptomyces sp. NPDC058576]|uniref:hypothetical protein n=1 Tax=Streptomyces sp. NPDC058576 TaxID=3346547 RepID=UPI00364EE85A
MTDRTDHPARAEQPGVAPDIPADSTIRWDPDSARLPRRNPREIRALLAAAPARWQAFPPAEDRAAWKDASRHLTAAARDGLLEAGRRAAEAPVPALPAALWRAYARTGERKPYETPWYGRRRLLSDLVVAYGLEPRQDLVDAMTDLLWAVCEETTWCFPAHDPRELPDARTPVVDLFAALTAVALAETLAVAGGGLPAPLVERVRREAEHRVIGPYLDSDSWSWLYNGPGARVTNWAAVCAFGAVGAACYLVDDDERLAKLLHKAAVSMGDYLENFDPDGGTSEGTGYWSFGFGSFCQLADLVERRTGGAWSWFDAPVARATASFPLRSRLSGTSWVTFSDVDFQVSFAGWLLHDLGRRYGDRELLALAAGPVSNWDWHRANSAVTTALRSVLSPGYGRDDAALPAPAPSDWFRGLQWLVSRAEPASPQTLAVAVKGGNNGEMHNQNDVGSLIVRCGGEDLVVDPGRGTYTREYFSNQRYTFLVNRSRGHSLPLPNGVEQREGGAFRASVRDVHRDGSGDRVRYDLTRAYPDEAHLASLEREVALVRSAAPHVRVTDTFAFTRDGLAESVFVTFAEVELREGYVLLVGERARLRIDLPDDMELDVSVESQEVVLAQSPLAVQRPTTIRRIAVRAAHPAPKQELNFVLTPVLTPA